VRTENLFTFNEYQLFVYLTLSKLYITIIFYKIKSLIKYTAKLFGLVPMRFYICITGNLLQHINTKAIFLSLIFEGSAQ
jgi:hypothetical protein